MSNHRVRMMAASGACALALVTLVACAAPNPPARTPGGMMGGGQGTGGAGQAGQPPSTGTASYSSTGQRILLTGVGGDGQLIAHSAPRVSQGALMIGGGGCGSCHGANGRGGTVQMMMGPAIKAPDVTYAALIKAGFTAATIGRAITQGLDEAGKPLDQAMPRWQMSTSDVQSTVAYLKVLGAQ